MQEHQSPQPGVRVLLRPVASPLPLGFLGLAGATFVLAAWQLGWVPVGEAPHVGVVLAAFAAPLQFLAAVYAFLARDTPVATGMGVLAGTWAVSGLVTALAPPGQTSGAVGLLMLVAAAGLLVSVLASGRGKLTADAVLVTAAARFTVTGGYELTGGEVWQTVSGVVGVVLAVVAVSAALAFASEDARGRPLLPTMRSGGPLSAVRPTQEVSPTATVGDVYQAPGVRGQL